MAINPKRRKSKKGSLAALEKAPKKIDACNHFIVLLTLFFLAPSILCFTILFPSAFAEIFQSDLDKPRDNKITVDNKAGLEWLDLDETSGRTIGSLISETAGRDYIGGDRFRFATRIETFQFFGNAGIAINGGLICSNSSFCEAVSTLMQALGTASAGEDFEVLQGRTEVNGVSCGPDFHTTAALWRGRQGTEFEGYVVAFVNNSQCFNNDNLGAISDGKFLVKAIENDHGSSAPA